jgi:hypothetical protein
MKVRMKSLMCGPEGTFHRDKVYDFSPEEAKQLLSGGFAEKVKQNIEVETATVSAPENTALRTKKKGRRPQMRMENEPETDHSPREGAGDTAGGEESPSD